MINKKLGVMVLALASMGLVACGGGGQSSQSSGSQSSLAPESTTAPVYDLSDGESITYWCPTTDTDFFAEKVDEFKEAHPEFSGDIEFLASVGEGEVKAELTKDPEVAADVFEIADDNIAQCVEASAMYVYNNDEAAYMRYLYGQEAVTATTVKGRVYGVPYRNDNGYVLSYDKSIVSDEQAKTVEGIIAACKAAGATFNFDLTNSWYTFAPVWAAGGRTYTDDQGVFHSDIATDEIAKVVAGFAKIVTDAGSTWNHLADDAKFGAAEGKLGAIVLWNNENSQKNVLGDNLGIAPLPSFSVDGKSYHLRTFQGFKALGIRRADALTAGKLKVAKAFTMFMGSDAVAEDRLVDLGQGVSNRNVIAKSQLWSSKWVAALNKMGTAGTTVSQANGTCGNYWDPAAALGTAIKNGTITDAATALNALTKCKTAQEATAA